MIQDRARVAYTAASAVRAIRIHENGDAQKLRLEDVPLPVPKPGEARVRHEAVGVNFIDVYHRTGLYPVPSLPSGLGVEGCGVVDAIGDGVTEVKVGDRVAYAPGPIGAYAEQHVVPAARLVKVPDELDAVTVAATLLKGMTAEFLIRRAFPVKAGQTVLFHAAAGGVGLLACQWLASLGATVIGTVGSDAKVEVAKRHGCAHVIVYTREDFAARVREITGGKGVPVVYDSVGKATFLRSLDCLAPRGMLVGFGNASGKPDPIEPNLLAQKGSLYLTRATLFTYVAERADLLESSGALFDALRREVIVPTVHERLPLERAADAHRALESRGTIGAMVLVP